MATAKATAKRTTDRFIGSVDGTWNEYISSTNIVRQLMTQAEGCQVGQRVATVKLNGMVFLAVERAGFVEEYDISNGATR